MVAVGAAVQGRRNFYADRQSNLRVSRERLRMIVDEERLEQAGLDSRTRRPEDDMRKNETNGRRE